LCDTRAAFVAGPERIFQSLEIIPDRLFRVELFFAFMVLIAGVILLSKRIILSTQYFDFFSYSVRPVSSYASRDFSRRAGGIPLLHTVAKPTFSVSIPPSAIPRRSMPETLDFENPRAVQALYANDLRLLKSLEDALKVKVTTREGWIKVDGDPENVDKARQVFRQLDTARKSGVEIRKHEFDYALRSVSQPSGSNGDGLDSLLDTKVHVSPRRAPIIPKTAGQRSYLQLIEKHDVVFGVGPAGTGKTYLAMAMAVSALKKEQVTRIILTRPAVEAGEALGFLPGDLNEKIFPYLRPLYDALGEMLDPEEMQRHVDRGVIEVAPLAYMRGRTLNRAFIVLDEAQNTTTEQMFMFLTRLGMDSKCVVTGDQTQIDLPTNKRSGLIEAMQALKGVEGIAFQHFEEKDVVRHPLVQSIVRAYKQYRGVKGSGAERP
jgi:phosphate starvation-inducible PhoH-like protein